MKISDNEVTLLLDRDGEAVMELAAVDINGPLYVKDTDDIGIWVEIDRESYKQIVLVRWDYVLSVVFRARERPFGLGHDD